MFLNRTGFRGGKSGNNGIRRIVLICLAILLGWFGWSLASTVRVLTQALGISVGTAISWMLKDFSFFFGELFSVKSLAVGLAIGLAGYFLNRKRNTAADEEAGSEETADKAEAPAAEQEEIIETTHYMFH